MRFSGEWDLTKQSTHVFEEYKHIASVSAGSIPYLDKENVYTHKISPYSLVRYQCLVQVSTFFKLYALCLFYRIYLTRNFSLELMSKRIIKLTHGIW